MGEREIDNHKEGREREREWGAVLADGRIARSLHAPRQRTHTTENHRFMKNEVEFPLSISFL